MASCDEGQLLLTAQMDPRLLKPIRYAMECFCEDLQVARKWSIGGAGPSVFPNQKNSNRPTFATRIATSILAATAQLIHTLSLPPIGHGQPVQHQA